MRMWTAERRKGRRMSKLDFSLRKMMGRKERKKKEYGVQSVEENG